MRTLKMRLEVDLVKVSKASRLELLPRQIFQIFFFSNIQTSFIVATTTCTVMNTPVDESPEVI